MLLAHAATVTERMCGTCDVLLLACRSAEFCFNFMHWLTILTVEQVHVRTCSVPSTTDINKDRSDSERISQQKLKFLCDTRWVERHTTFEDVLALYEPLLACLEAMVANADKVWDAKSIVEANGLLRSITSAEFIAAFHTNLHFFGYTKPLSIKLQSASKDVLSAYKEVREVVEILQEERQTPDKAFEKVYKRMVDMAEMAATAKDQELPTPRRCGRQTPRSNVESTTPEEYWRRTAFLPFLDHLITEFESRFSELSSAAVQGLLLLPGNLNNLNDEKEAEIRSRFAADLPEPNTFQEELKRWRKKWEIQALADASLPSNINDALLEANTLSFPNIQRILTILLVAPVTTCRSRTQQLSSWLHQDQASKHHGIAATQRPDSPLCPQGHTSGCGGCY